jgi:hypothetical protein
MRRKPSSTSKSNYRPPNRNEKILAIVGLLVVGSLIFTAVAPNFVVKVPTPTEPPVTYITLVANPPTATVTPEPTSGTPQPPTPGQAPAPNVTP